MHQYKYHFKANCCSVELFVEIPQYMFTVHAANSYTYSKLCAEII